MNWLAQLSNLQILANNFYVTDFFDVLVIAVFVYFTLILFKQTRSFSILGGVGVVIVLYGIAQVFNLTLTTLVLQAFFGAFIIVLAVVFQEELRRFFEIIALAGSRQQKSRAAMTKLDETLDALIQAFGSLAHRKIGALVVLAGSENIERHAKGGVVLDGVVSQELLESIFDPTSPGHDGAVIINKDRVQTLGAHLPLSHNFAEIGKYGTRHSAALGIAERSDALAVVVSEERGAISIARQGKLQVVADMDDLEKELRAFFKEKFPAQAVSFWKTLLAKNTFEKILAIGVACLFWFFLVFEAGSVRRDFTVPISYRNLAENLIIQDSRPKTLVVTLQSRGKSFEQLDPQTLEAAVDASKLGVGEHKISVTEDLVRHPITFSVIGVSPTQIQLKIERAPKEASGQNQPTIKQ